MGRSLLVLRLIAITTTTTTIRASTPPIAPPIAAPADDDEGVTKYLSNFVSTNTFYPRFNVHDELPGRYPSLQLQFLVAMPVDIHTLLFQQPPFLPSAHRSIAEIASYKRVKYKLEMLTCALWAYVAGLADARHCSIHIVVQTI